MKIAFLHNANNPHVITRIKYLLKNNHEVFYFGLPPTGDLQVPLETQCHQITTNRFVEKFRILSLIAKMFLVRYLVKKHQIDILHIMWAGYGIYAPLSGAKKIVIENMGSDVLVYPKKSVLWRILLFWSYKYADAVIQGAEHTKKAGIKYGASEKNNELVEVGIDFSVFNLEVASGVARRKLGIDEKQKFVLSPRSFTELYNIETIIRSIPLVTERFPDVVFGFCKYSGEMDKKYHQLAEQLQVEKNIKFLGFLDSEKELPFYYRDADVVISVPSSDSSPKTVYESMACGTPVLISDLPWYKGKFEANCEIGVVPVKDHIKLADYMVQILKKDISLNINKAYSTVFEHINQEKENRKLELLYNSILGAG